MESFCGGKNIKGKEEGEVYKQGVGQLVAIRRRRDQSLGLGKTILRKPGGREEVKDSAIP